MTTQKPSYILTPLPQENIYDMLVTILDANISISDYIAVIKPPHNAIHCVLFDTILCTDNKTYRFLETVVVDGKIKTGCAYNMEITDETIAIANQTLVDNIDKIGKSMFDALNLTTIQIGDQQ